MISAAAPTIAQPFQPSLNKADGRAPAPRQDDHVKAQDVRAVAALSEEEKTQVEQLKKIDREVRAHERAHKNAGGQYAGSASFGYTVGPDGRRYAVSGEVPIDIAPIEGDPAATIAKMAAIISAALAPEKPSGQDRRVAALAASLRAKAQAELAKISRDKLSGEGKDSTEATHENSIKIPAIEAYEAGSFAANNEKSSGRVVNFFS